MFSGPKYGWFAWPKLLAINVLRLSGLDLSTPLQCYHFIAFFGNSVKIDIVGVSFWAVLADGKRPTKPITPFR